MAGPTRPVLGRLACPWCNSTKGASARLSGKDLAYVLHECCQMQTFARSGKSDQLIRDRIKPEDTAPAPAAGPEPTIAASKPAKGIFGW